VLNPVNSIGGKPLKCCAWSRTPLWTTSILWCNIHKSNFYFSFSSIKLTSLWCVRASK